LGDSSCEYYDCFVFTFFKDIPGLPITVLKLIEKFQTGVKNRNIKKIVAFEKHLPELFFVLYFHSNKNVFLTLKNSYVADLTHFSTKYRGAVILKFLKITEHWIVDKLV